jgi:hypothetical protein
MFIVAEVGVFCLWEHWHMWNIRPISDASVGISWTGSGAVRKAAFMLLREVSARVVMVFKGSLEFVLGKQCKLEGEGAICRELSRDLNKRYSQ